MGKNGWSGGGLRWNSHSTPRKDSPLGEDPWTLSGPQGGCYGLDRRRECPSMSCPERDIAKKITFFPPYPIGIDFAQIGHPCTK
jgi:hypothetical protein